MGDTDLAQLVERHNVDFLNFEGDGMGLYYTEPADLLAMKEKSL